MRRAHTCCAGSGGTRSRRPVVSLRPAFGFRFERTQFALCSIHHAFLEDITPYRVSGVFAVLHGIAQNTRCDFRLSNRNYCCMQTSACRRLFWSSFSFLCSPLTLCLLHQLQNLTLSILHNLVPGLCPQITFVGKRKLQVQQRLHVIHFSGLRRIARRGKSCRGVFVV